MQVTILENGRPRTERNMPLIAGQLKFAQEVAVSDIKNSLNIHCVDWNQDHYCYEGFQEFISPNLL